MNTPTLPQLCEHTLGCQVYDSAWRPDHTPEDFATAVSGQHLNIEMSQWAQGDSRQIDADAGEEMAAVLSGRFELRCGPETHVLEPGLGLLIPPGHARHWTALESGVLYRVTCPPRAA